MLFETINKFVILLASVMHLENLSFVSFLSQCNLSIRSQFIHIRRLHININSGAMHDSVAIGWCIWTHDLVAQVSLIEIRLQLRIG